MLDFHVLGSTAFKNPIDTAWTISFNVLQFFIMPTESVYLLFSQWTAVVSLNSVNQLKFVVEKYCAPREVRIELYALFWRN
jgi:hypothetical protein